MQNGSRNLRRSEATRHRKSQLEAKMIVSKVTSR